MFQYLEYYGFGWDFYDLQLLQAIIKILRALVSTMTRFLITVFFIGLANVSLILLLITWIYPGNLYRDV